jgi:hypothetical protein
MLRWIWANRPPLATGLLVFNTIFVSGSPPLFKLKPNRRNTMKFNPCADLCTYDGSHCQGCGRSHEEIAATKKLVMSIVDFVQTQQYDNSDDFIDAVSKSARKKLQKKP